MKTQRKKLILGIITLLLLSCAYYVILRSINVRVNTVYSSKSETDRLKNLSASVTKDLTLYGQIREELNEQHISSLTLKKDIYESSLESADDVEPTLFDGENGAVILLDGDEVVYPGGYPENARFDGRQLRASSFGQVFSDGYTRTQPQDSFIICFFRIFPHYDIPFYYVEWESEADLEANIQEFFNIESTLTAVAQSHGAGLLVASAVPNSAGHHDLLYASDRLPSSLTAEAYGISAEAFTQAAEDFNELSVDELTAIRQTVTLDGNDFNVYPQKSAVSSLKEDLLVIYMLSSENTDNVLLELRVLILVIFIGVCIFFLAWFISTRMLVHDHDLSETQKKSVNPGAVRKRAVSIAAVGTVVILAVYLLFLSLLRLSSVCLQVGTAFTSLKQRILESSEQEDIAQEAQKKTYVAFAKLIAEMLEDDRSAMTPATLQTACEMIEAEYIMIFDGSGRQIATNSDYVSLSLGSDPDSATYEFRQLLTGTPVVVHDLQIDEATGAEHMLVGVRMKDEHDDGKYNALIVAVNEEQLDESIAESTSDLMAELVPEDMLSFSVDPETSLIVNSTDDSLAGKNAAALGLPEKALQDGYRDFVRFNGVPCYGECEDIDGILYYYMARQAIIYRNIWPLSLIVAGAALLLLCVFALCLLPGYRRYFDTWADVGQPLVESIDEVSVAGGKRKHSTDPSKRWRGSVEEYGVRAPFHIARLVIEGLLLAFIVLLQIRVALARTDANDSVFAFILQGSWTKGFNLFAVTNILILLIEVFFVVVIGRLLLRLVSGAVGTKGETICRLALNLLDYGGAIFFLYHAMYYLGFQPGTLLASLGLMSFAISLGAKDLITDIIAGLSIVFDGEYQVGDIIIVDNYRGEVLEIGVRTTKLAGRGGNIKIIFNRDVKNVINLTRMNSWYPLEVSVPGDQSLDEIEQLLRDQLPAIGKSIPEIVSGPFYKGIVSIGKGIVTLSIIAECNEADYYTVQRAVNHMVQELLEKHGIKIV